MNLSVELNINITQFLCHPSEEQKTKDLLTRNGLGKYVNLVTPIEFVKPGRMIAVDNNKLMYCSLFRKQENEDE